MPTIGTVPATASSEMASMLQELQQETIARAAPVLFVFGFLLLNLTARFPQPAQAGLPALVVFLVPVAVWTLCPVSYLAGAWALVLGCLIADLLLVAWGDAGIAVCLLALPTGLAALFVHAAGGALVAAACSLLLLLAPVLSLPIDDAIRLTALILVWMPVGLVWLTRWPLLTGWQWSWSGYRQNRQLLEEARDAQVQLKQALADLADANLQLTRLNRLAQGLRQTAEEARRAKEQFVANVSHELRTPLNMIIGFSEMIVGAPETYADVIPPALLADLAVILRNSQHLSSLIDDVLDLSQIEAKQMALTKERVALAEIVEAAAVAVRPLFRSKGLYLRTEIPQDLLVFCDRTRIREVVLNLLSNAGRFTERGGVRVLAWHEGNDVVVSVDDTGPGIGSEDKDRIFRPFHQVDGSVRRRYGGTGLGLTISRSFVELHGGRMWFESQVGVGTTFFFRLPVDPPTPMDTGVSRWFSPYWEYDERPRRPSPPRPAVRPRFVVLESGDSLQRLLTRYLDGVEIAPVSSLEEALQELARVPALALLVNETSPGEALRRLNEAVTLPYGTPAMACFVPGVYEAADALGVSDYLVKPISRDALLGALDRLSLKGNTVLVVDDEPEALRLFRRMLASTGRGYCVLRAPDGRQALDILRRQRPDAILLDLIMPDMDGFQLLAAKSADPALRDIPTIVISARDPAGQPILTGTLAVARGGGLSTPQLLACIQAFTQILSAAAQPDDPVLTGKSSG